MELTALETAFYTLGIVLMSIMVILMIVTVVVILYIRHKINMIQKSIEDKIRDVADRPQKAAFDLGVGIMDKIINKRKKK